MTNSQLVCPETILNLLIRPYEFISRVDDTGDEFTKMYDICPATRFEPELKWRHSMGHDPIGLSQHRFHRLEAITKPIV